MAVKLTILALCVALCHAGYINRDTRCPPSFSGYVPNVKDPGVYLACYNGDAALRTCREGLIFDSQHQRCISPTASYALEDIDRGKIPELGETYPNGCPVDYYITYLTAQQDCSLYYSCVNGEKVSQFCFHGLLFSYQQQACVWPWEADCRGDSDGGSPPDAGTETDSPDVPAQLEPESAVPEFEEAHPNGCPIDYYITYLTPHEDCSLFYSCVHGRKVTQTCQPWLFFNYRQQACVWAWESDCRGGSGGGSGTEPGTDVPAQPEPESAIPELGETHPNGCPVDYYITYHTPHQECSLFYTCVHGEKVEQNCQPELSFDYRQQACVWPWESDCKGGSPPDAGTEPGNPDVPTQPEPESAVPEFDEKHPNGCPVDYNITYLSPHQDCRRFYSCVHGNKVAQTCVPGLFFNYRQQVCVWPWESDCDGGSDGGNPPVVPGNPDGTDQPEPESAIPDFDEAHPNGCPVDYYITYHTPHQDCSLFYTCVHGEKIVQNCSSGLSFDYRQQACVWPWESDCSGDSTPGGGAEPGNTEVPPQPEPESAVPEFDEAHPNGCPIDYYITYLTPHQDCRLFYSCVHGNKVAQKCVPGLFFNYRQQACVWPWESECRGGSGGGSPPVEPGNPGNPDIPPQPEPESVIPEFDESYPNGCPVDYYITYLTHHEDCNLFYTCVFGEKIAQRCQPGLWFSYWRQACVWTWESDCTGGSGGGSPPEVSPEPGDPDTTDVPEPGYPDTTEVPAQPEPGYPDSTEVPAQPEPGYPDTTDVPAQPEPESAVPEFDEAHPNGCPIDYYITYLTPHEDCSLFYSCVHGRKVTQTCQPWLFFNYRQQACVWAWESDCRGGSGGGSGTEPGTDVPAQPEPESAIPELGETHPNGCPVDYYITYHTPHQECSLFYTCVHGEKVEQNCQPELSFDYRQQACVWPWESDCKGGSPPDAGTEPGNPGVPTQPEPESAVPEFDEKHPNGCPVDYNITYLSPHQDCRRFYSCVHGNKVAQTCVPGLFFNYRQQVCVWPWESDCDGGSDGGNPPVVPGNPDGTDQPEPESAIPDFDEAHPNGCPVDYYITYHTPHQDCSLFYTCVHGEKIVQNCSSGLSFDYRQQACVWPWESDCSGDSTPGGGAEPGNTEVPPQPEPESAVPEFDEAHPNGCPIDYYITYLTPHQDCRLFYSCVHGNKVAQKCVPGLFFNYRQQACVWPWESECRGGSGGGSPPVEPGNPGNPDIPPQPEPESAIPEFDESYPNGCPVDYYITYLTHHEDCNLFYTCVFGEKIAQRCQPGLWFSYWRQACVWTWESDCTGGSGGGSPPEVSPEPGYPDTTDVPEPGYPDTTEVPAQPEPGYPDSTEVPAQPEPGYPDTTEVPAQPEPGYPDSTEVPAQPEPGYPDTTEVPAQPEPGYPDTTDVPAQPEPESAVPEFDEAHPNGCPIDYYITYLTPHEDCSLFYSCVHGRKVTQKCQPWLFFNYRQQACVWAWESDCRGGSGGGSGTEPGTDVPAQPEPESAIPELGETHPNGCPVDYYITYHTPHQECSLFYTCVHGEKVEQNCQPELSFDYRQQACVWPWESDCKGGSPPDAGTEPGNPDVPTQPEPESAIPEFDEKHPNGCPVDYDITYLSPHQDCRRFYSCVHGNKVAQTCVPGLFFNYRQQVCVWPWESDCEGGSDGGNPPVEPGNPDGTDQPEPESAIPEFDEKHPNGCPVDYYITYHTPHQDCSLFYTCVHGEKIVQNCSSGLSFDYRQQACVWPWESDCNGGSPPDAGTEPGNPDVPTQPEPESAIPEFDEKHPNGCPVDYKITYLTPHQDCRRFYSCVHGNKVAQSCVPGLFFNYRQQACVWPWESECRGGSGGGSPPVEPGNPGNPDIPSQPESESAIPEFDESYPNGCPVDYNITYLTHHEDCNLFYTCVFGEKIAQRCQPGLWFSYWRQACVWIWESDCTGGSGGGNPPEVTPEPGYPDTTDVPAQPKPESAIPEFDEAHPNGCPVDYRITYLTPHEDCSLFYSCVHGKKVSQKCVPGLFFNYRQQACLWPWESDCSGDSGGSNPPDAGSEPGNPGNPEVPAQPESAIPEFSEKHTNGCPVNYYITYLTPHQDCSLYYTCVYGEKISQKCQFGLSFSYGQQACVWPWESDCRGDSPPDAGVEPGNPGNPDAPVQPEPESAVPESGETHPNGCPVDYRVTYLTTHEDCSLYYSCVYGKKVAQKCVPGLLFNYRQQACVWSWESDCLDSSGGASPPDAGSEPGNPDVPAQPETESAIPELGDKYPNGCPVDYYITYLTAHKDCSLYYTCVNGEKISQKCQLGLFFNYRQQACLWPWESDCRSGSPPDAGSEPSNPANPDVPNLPEPQSAIPDLGETHANGCPVDYYITFLMPHQDCSLYYSCVYGEKVEQSCQPGLLFSYQQQACVWPWETDCQEGSATEPGNTEVTEAPAQPEPESAIPELGETHPNGCPVDYYITYLTPHPVCSLYYTCLYGEKVEQYCQPGLLFNYRLQSCVWPEESDCVGRKTLRRQRGN